jgi:hypothetical protein
MATNFHTMLPGTVFKRQQDAFDVIGNEKETPDETGRGSMTFSTPFLRTSAHVSMCTMVTRTTSMHTFRNALVTS